MKKFLTDTSNFNKMIIHVRGYCADFNIEEYIDKSVKPEQININSIEKRMKVEIIETAMVKGVTLFLEEGELFLQNANYKKHEFNFNHLKQIKR